jgi:hypothetical protein
LQELQELGLEEAHVGGSGMRDKVKRANAIHERLETLKAGVAHESQEAEHFSKEARGCLSKVAAARQELRKLEKASNGVSVCSPQSFACSIKTVSNLFIQYSGLAPCVRMCSCSCQFAETVAKKLGSYVILLDCIAFFEVAD